MNTRPALAIRPLPMAWRSGAVAVVAAALTSLVAGGAHAAWPSSGAAVTSATGTQDPRVTVGTSVCPDDEGGLISAWRSGTTTIRITRLDPESAVSLWNSGNGAVVTSTAGGPPHVARDGLGGAWVVWRDTRAAAPGLYVQRFDASGVEQFTAGGRLFSNGPVDSQGDDDVDIEATPSGKLLVAFWDGGVRLQRLQRLTGADDWGVTAVQLSVDPQVRALDLDEAGEGAAVVWESQRLGLPGNDHIIASFVSSSGQEQWGDEGVVVQSQTTVTPLRPACVWESGSLFVVWAHHVAARTGLVDVNAQKLNASGVAQWGTTAGGLSVLLAPQTGFETTPQIQGVTRPAIVADGLGGCIIVWQDGRNYHLAGSGGFLHGWDLYGQRINGSGVVQWDANGEVVDDALGEQFEHVMVTDGSQGAIVVYTTFENTNKDIAALRLNGSGSRAWKSNISNFATDDQTDPVAAADGLGGVLAAWSDQRNASTAPDVYATHRNSSGGAFAAALTVTAPNGGERLIAGVTQQILWTSNFAGNVKLEYQRAGFPRATIAASTVNDGAHAWGVPNLPSTQVKVHASMPSDGSPADSSNAYFTICGTPFVSGTSFMGLPGARDVAVADFDEDGILDLAVPVTGGVAIARGQGSAGMGDGTFAAPVTYAMASNGRGAVARDLDDDGILDLAVTNATGVGILRGNGTGGVGNGTFAAVTPLVTGSEPIGIAAGDFNEDGVVDLAVANSTANTLSVLLGVGAGGVGTATFSTPTHYATSGAPQRVVVGDFNEDGVADLAVTCFDGGDVRVYLGVGAGAVGNGTFAAGVSYSAGVGPRGIAAGDFNEDGRTDIAVGNSNTAVAVLLGNGLGGVGNGTFGPYATYLGEGGNRDLVVGDFTGDGIADLAVAAGDYNQISIYAGTGTGTTGNGAFQFIATFGTGAMPEAIAAGDFDESGTADLVTANRGTSSALSIDGQLTGCNTLSEVLAVTAPSAATSHVLGTELTIAWTRGARVVGVDVELSRDGGVNWERLAENVTETSMAWTVTAPTSAAARVRVIDPLVGSRQDVSDVDFIISDGTAIALAGPNGGEQLLTPGRATITWTSNFAGSVALEYSIDGGARQSIIASTPNDGSHDWVLPLVDASNVLVHVSDAADGTPEDQSNAPFSICTRVAAEPVYAPLSGALSVRSGDFNEDGRADLAAPVGTGVGVMLGLDGGGLSAATVFVTGGTSHRDVALGDFNADGMMDVAVSYSAGVGILRGNGAAGVGDGTFAGAVPYPAGASPRELAAADLNADGILDLVVTNSGGSDVSVLMGNGASGVGDGTFAPAVSLPVGTGPNRVRAHDIDLDGALDLLVTNGNFASSSVSVLRGQLGPQGPTGLFSTAVNYPCGANPNGLSIGDLDGDGAPDLAVGANVAQGLSILLGQTGPGGPTGTFAAAAFYPVGFAVSGTSVVDWNDDGLADVAAVSSAGDRLLFFEGLGDGTVLPVGFLPVGDGPNSLLAADLDGDGAIDYVVPGFSSNDLTVFRGGACGTSPSGTIGLVGLTAGEPWTQGQRHTVTWISSQAVAGVDIELSRNDGVDWVLLAGNVGGVPEPGKRASDLAGGPDSAPTAAPIAASIDVRAAGAAGHAAVGPRSWSWWVTGPPTTMARLRVRDASHPTVQAQSQAFTITDVTTHAPAAQVPLRFLMSYAGPNPFRDRARFLLALPHAAQARLDVFDVRGRRVRELDAGMLHAGNALVEWDGRDDTGANVAAGVFFVRVRMGGFESAIRVVRAR